MGFDVTQDATNFYVELTNITYSGRVVAYNPKSVEIYRSLWPIMVPTIRTVVTIPKPVDEGTYCFFFYDLNDVAHSGWNKCVPRSITPSRYRCTSNGCVTDPAGVYSDLASCQAGCASAGVVATTITAWPQDSEPGDSVIIKATYKNNTAQTLLSDLKIFFDGKLIKTESGKSFSAYATYELTYIYYLPFDTVPGNHTITATATGQTTNIPTFTYRSAGTPSRYSCKNGMCTADPAGAYTSLSACQSACQSQYHNVCQNGTCVTITGAGTDECPTNGSPCNLSDIISISADKQRDTKAFTATISVSWPNGAGKKVGFQHPGSILTDCINYITLDSNGKGSTQIEITSSTEYLAALDGCCRANLPGCKYSNKLSFTVDAIDWSKMVLYAGGLIAAAYVASKYIESRKG